MSSSIFKCRILGIETVLFSSFDHSDEGTFQILTVLGGKKIRRQEVKNIRDFGARSAPKSKNFRARSARKQRKWKFFVVGVGGRRTPRSHGLRKTLREELGLLAAVCPL